MSRDLELVFQNPERFRESRAPHLRQWLSRLVREVAPQADSFAVSFVSEGEMRQLNRSFRGRDAPTDVLSFPGDLPTGKFRPCSYTVFSTVWGMTTKPIAGK